MGTRQGRTMGGRMAVFMAGLAVAWLSAGVFAQPGDPGDLAKPPPIPPETGETLTVIPTAGLPSESTAIPETLPPG